MGSCKTFLTFDALRGLCNWTIPEKCSVIILTTDDGTQFLPISSASYLIGKDRQFLIRYPEYITGDGELLDILTDSTNVPRGAKRCKYFISQAEFLRCIVDKELLPRAKAEAFVAAIFDGSSTDEDDIDNVSDADVLRLAREAYLESSRWKKAQEEIKTQVAAELEEAKKEARLKAKLRKCVESADYDKWVTNLHATTREAEFKKQKIGQ